MGVAAWLVVLGAWCSSFCSYGWINSVGTFQEYYQSGPLREYTASQIAWIPALQIFFMSALGPVFGQLFDRYGPKYLLLVGSFLQVFGLMMASISTKYYQFILSQGVCSAMGVAAVFLSAIGCVSGWFDKKRGLAFGILATGSSIGGIIFPILLNTLIDNVGYGWAMRTAAFIIAGMLVIANLTIRRHHPPSLVTLSKEQLVKPFRELPYVALLTGLALVPFGLYTPIDYLPTAAIMAGTNVKLSQDLVAFYNASSLIGRISSGFLADKLGRFNTFITACYTAGFWIIAMWIPASNDSITIAFTVLFGMFSGAYISLMPALIAQLSPIDEIGYRNGISSLAGCVGGLLSTPIAGKILQGHDGLVGMKIFAGTFILAGTTGALVARIARTGFKLNVVF
ncbi:hypothetical protein OIDMADRAFT_195593 [Oidiodendron maius Zn]|uniref:Major facilitator superfamily (MFS) profile domain-containing protein n=1 Tax=Oidiodendron maius (strain Zn) TaxID=913774 RepID=A0A0C3H461_OIDMZ|nr:hypothetical protein OIDMADRAFT_195593 [Oidiodendron maius Zn]